MPDPRLCRAKLHLMTPENTRMRKDGPRCLSCIRIRRHRSKLRRRKFVALEPEIEIAESVPCELVHVGREAWVRTFARLRLLEVGEALVVHLGRHYQPNSGSLLWAARRTGMAGCYVARWFAAEDGLELYLRLVRRPKKVGDSVSISVDTKQHVGLV